MGRSIYKNLRVTKHDTLETAMEKNEKLTNRILKLEKENTLLKSKNKTLKDSWDKTEVYLSEVTKGSSLADIIKHVKVDQPFEPITCSKCGSTKARKLEFNDFSIIICKECNHREKVDERISEETV